MVRVLFDHDIDQAPFSVIFEAVRRHIYADFRGETVSPPRHVAEFGDGGIVFTIGGSEDAAGFRAYETFPFPKLASEDQIVAAWDRTTRRLMGIAVGERLGALRTGALAGVAIDCLSAPKVQKLAVIGTGLQAETQIIAAAHVREIQDIAVFSRSQAGREAFAARMAAKLGREIRAAISAEDAVSGADVVTLATSSEVPVIEAGWLEPHALVITLGPKTKSAHELPLELADAASIIVSDSPQQIAAMGVDHMLHGSRAYENIRHLGDLGVSATAGSGPALFLSAGLAGTEVAALAAIVSYLEKVDLRGDKR